MRRQFLRFDAFKINTYYLPGFPKNFAQYLYGICEYNYTTCKIEVFSVVVEQIQILYQLQRKQKQRQLTNRKKDCKFRCNEKQLIRLYLVLFLVQFSEIERKL